MCLTTIRSAAISHYVIHNNVMITKKIHLSLYCWESYMLWIINTNITQLKWTIFTNITTCSPVFGQHSHSKIYVNKKKRKLHIKVRINKRFNIFNRYCYDLFLIQTSGLFCKICEIKCKMFVYKNCTQLVSKFNVDDITENVWYFPQLFVTLMRWSGSYEKHLILAINTTIE